MILSKASKLLTQRVMTCGMIYQNRISECRVNFVVLCRGLRKTVQITDQHTRLIRMAMAMAKGNNAFDYMVM